MFMLHSVHIPVAKTDLHIAIYIFSNVDVFSRQF